MAYLPTFRHDIFISYARVDDQKSPDGDEGWVALFQEHLEIELSKRIGRMGLIDIWRDTRDMAGNQYFDEEIRESINDSGLFLALFSKGYLSPDGYCRKELKWFYEKAVAEHPASLKIGTRSRIFNLLLNNIPPPEWPPECAGLSGQPFHDARRPHESGMPSRMSGELFDTQLRKLADEIYESIVSYKQILVQATEAAAPPVDNSAATVADNDNVAEADAATTITPPAGPSFTVFLADTTEGLKETRERVINELKRDGVQIISNIPPPYDPEKHEQKIKDEMSKVNLAIHLLDKHPGEKVIEGEEGKMKKTYLQRQAELGLKHANSQFIWLTHPLVIDTVQDDGYRDFLRQLDSGERGKADYAFIRQSPGSVSREITAKIEQMKRAGTVNTLSSAALLDTHQKDQVHALSLSRMLIKKKFVPLITSEEDDPKRNIEGFENMLKQVRLLIIIFGHVASDWVRERLSSALQIAADDNCSLRACAVYLPPLKDTSIYRQLNLSSFPVSRPIILFDEPQKLAPILDTLMED